MVDVMIRGGGDLASGVAARLHRAGLGVVITELLQPLVVRRMASFAQAVFSGQIEVEGIRARRVANLDEAGAVLAQGEIAVLVDESLSSLADLQPVVLVDARMRKRPPETALDAADLVVGLGPGFVAGENCHAVVETMRGHDLGRVFWQGGAMPDTGVPESVMKKEGERVLRAPVDGVLQGGVAIGRQVKTDEVIAHVDEAVIKAPFDGVLRGLVADGLQVRAGMKVGDLDPRNDPSYAFRISDKALAVGGGVLEAVLTRPEVRDKLWR